MNEQFLFRYDCLPKQLEEDRLHLPSRDHMQEYGPFLGCIAIGMAIVYLYPSSWVFVSAAHSLGDALTVAGILGLTIETFVADLLVKRTAAELSERLVGYGLPGDAQDVISSIVTATRVYRGYRKVYEIDCSTGDTVTVHITVSYTVVNNGKETDKYKPRLEEEAIYDPTFHSLTYGQFHVNGKIWERNEKTRVVSIEPEHPVQIKPSKASESLETLSAEQRCDVQWRYSLIMPCNYNDVTSFGGITIRPTIECSRLPEDFEFEASDDPRGENKCEHVPGSTVWKYNRAFVRSQHFRAWWRRK